MSWHDIAGSADSINMNDDVTMLYTANFILGPPDIFKAKVWPTLDQYIGLKKRPMYWSRLSALSLNTLKYPNRV